MPFDTAGPTMTIYINDVQLGSEFSAHVLKVECEQARDLADQITLTMLNPIKSDIGTGDSHSEYLYTDSKAFQPGNEITVYMGYNGINAFVGRGIISKYLPSFRSSGIPQLSLKAMDASVKMMESSNSMDGATYPDMSYSEIIKQLAGKYGLDIGEVEDTPSIKQTIKKAGVSDYKFAKGLANLMGFEFKVRWDTRSRKWKVYWRTPKSDQKSKYTFRYGAGDDTTLIEFNPQFGLRDTATEVKVLYFDSLTRTWEEMSVKQEKTGEGITFTGSERMAKEITTASAIRIDAAGTSVEVVAERPFSSPEDAYTFAQRWLAARRDNFIMGDGTAIGIETLAPGHIHAVTGIGKQLSGDWEFTTVRHVMDRDKGYRTHFFAHKVLE